MSNNKKYLTLNDKDFTIKYGKLFINKELEEADFDTSELNIELSYEVMSKIVESTVKESLQFELEEKVRYLNLRRMNPVYDDNITKSGSDRVSGRGRVIGSGSGSGSGSIIINIPDLTYKLPDIPPNTLELVRRINSNDFKVNIRVSDRMK